MASLIPGFEYDIFISYRQKDNKYDGWVTDFVENLKKELEATIKEEVSVYFDINPHDGLLEIHDVGDSLREKLRCLVFVPVISRTYCDPKSFAWEHEFKAFVEMASRDQFGSKITISGGNVVNRVLPIRIHELDAEDIKLCEAVLGGVLRGIEFIYRAQGVNRPLRSKEDKPQENLNQTIYRDQINKIANGICDVINSIKKMLQTELTGQIRLRDEVAENVLIRTTSDRRSRQRKKPENIYATIKAGGKKLTFVVSALLFSVVLAFSCIFIVKRKANIKWALNEALPESEMKMKQRQYHAAFMLLQKAGKYISGNPDFNKLDSLTSIKINIHSDPQGAKLYYKVFPDTTNSWEFIGITPVDSLKTAINSLYQYMMIKPGYDTVITVCYTGGYRSIGLSRKLFPSGDMPEGMVYAQLTGKDEPYSFFIDKYEVTNKQYLEFIRSGGYQQKVFWKFPFVKDNDTIDFEEAMTLLTDKTGRPGPATWLAGSYPKGEDNFPVRSISWYEAAAYAAFSGNSLPAIDSWSSASTISYLTFAFIPGSNFKGNGPRSVYDLKGMHVYGTFGMFGNVREWCYNEVRGGRVIRGGAWDDPTYVSTNIIILPPFDRSEKNGLRCVRYMDSLTMTESIFAPRRSVAESSDYNRLIQSLRNRLMTEEAYQVYLKRLNYDKTGLDAKLIHTDDAQRDWKVERAEFNNAYGGKMAAFLFLPKSVYPPYQTVIFCPGSDGWSDSTEAYIEGWLKKFDFILKDGRALVLPVLTGMFERRTDLKAMEEGPNSIEQLIINAVKDFRRTIDYLETRSDIDTTRLCYMGASAGGRLGPAYIAAEARIKISIFYVGGVVYNNPELDFAAHVRIPTLMLNGYHDPQFSYLKQSKPMFDLLGTPESDKVQKVYDTDHFVPYNELVKEVLGWLDKYFGPVIR